MAKAGNVTALAGALTGRHFLALQKTGTILAWGNTDWGQGGAGISTQEQATPMPVKLTGVKAVFATGNNSFAVLADGSFWIWGRGASYPRQWPVMKNSAVPVKLDLPN